MKYQKLVFITGAPSVGKTATGEAILGKVSNSAFLDGDWLWHVNPFDLDDKRLRNGDRSMSFALETYLKSDFEVVIFSSVILVVPEIRKAILEGIGCKAYEFYCFHLKCSKESLLERHRGQGEKTEPAYEWLDIKALDQDIVLNTDGETIDGISDAIIGYIERPGIRNDSLEEMKILTDRMVLRTVAIDDLDDVVAGLHLDEGPCTKEEAIKEIEWMENNHRNNRSSEISHVCLAMMEKRERSIIGWCGLDNRNRGKDSPALFYLLKEKYWNRGLATEAANSLLEYAFGGLNLKKIHAGVAPDNSASKRVLEKIGMRYIGLDEEGGYHFELEKDEYGRNGETRRRQSVR